MQYSTNSNAAMVSIIRGKPTLIGQYRQAKLEIWRRSQDLEAAKLELQKQELKLKLAQLDIEIRSEMDTALPKGKTPMLIELDEQRAITKRAIAEIDAESLKRAIINSQELAKDTQREIEICERELERIREEATAIGIDIESLSEQAFQALMGEDYRIKRGRYFAAQTLAPQIGWSPAAIEEFLEIPEADRPAVMAAQQAFLSGFLNVPQLPF
jgi:hypothetical protein